MPGEQELLTLYENAEKIYNIGKLDEAITEFSKILELAPKTLLTAKAANFIGTIYQDKEDDLKAADYYKKAIEIDPNYLEAYLGLGDAYFYQENYDEALEQYSKVLGGNPEIKLKAECIKSIGLVYNKQEKYDDAITEFNKIIELEVDNNIKSEALRAIGEMYTVKENNNQALAKFREARELDNTLDDAHLQLAEAINIFKDEDKGLDEYNKIIESNPNGELAAKAYIKIGDIYFDVKEDYNEAEKSYKEAIKICPNSKLAVESFLQMGEMYRKQKKYGEAIENYKSAIKIDPNLEDAHYFLADSLYNKKLHKEALLEIDEAIRINPKDASNHNLKGVIFWKKQYQKALEEFNKAIELDPTHYWAHLNLAVLYEDKKQNKKAVDEWINCLIYAEDYDQRDTKANNHLKKLGISENEIEKLKVKMGAKELVTEDKKTGPSPSSDIIRSLIDKYKEYERTNQEEIEGRQKEHQEYKKFLSIDVLKKIPLDDFKNFLYNLLYKTRRMPFTGQWRGKLNEKPEIVKDGLIELFNQLESGILLDEAVDKFLSKMPVNCESFVTAVLFDYDIERYIPFSEKIKKRMRRLNLYPSDRIDRKVSFGQEYKLCNEILNDFGKKYDLTLDSLDHFLWWIEDSNINLSNDSKVLSEFLQNVDDLSKKTFLPIDFLEKIRVLLEDKHQLIFYGVPGTGKTFVAKEFANFFANCATGEEIKNRVNLIQFHQSYSYEEFMEGIRPETLETSSGKKEINYSVHDGIFKKFCKKAKENGNEKFLLIIDEINRGNISKIFGELLYLLEYRNSKITLPYSGDEFDIPENVYIIGTMNTADRSIALVDYALRRRFYFIEFLPDAEILRKWMDENENKKSNYALNYFIKLNEKIKTTLDEHHQIGHSYFMINDGTFDKSKLSLIWEYNIMPLLKEYFFTKTRNNLDEFHFDSLMKN